MLSSDILKSPRPLPPSRLRRPTSQSSLHSPSPLDSRAPPPYAPPDSPPALLGSPITAPSRVMRYSDELERLQATPELEEWVEEKSKEEIEGLLHRAASIIKEREQEFNETSETCKHLSESNAVLKARNNALKARLPTSQPCSPSLSPSQSYASPHSNSPSFMQNISSPSMAPRCRRGHARAPSSTPAELALLADQNAELLAKLQDLEGDAARAEQAGKKRLKHLEKEIQGLKDELDKAREAGERLEQSVQSQGLLGQKMPLPEGLEDEIMKMWKKMAREVKVKELKAKTRPWDQDDPITEPKDFAPGNPLSVQAQPFTPERRPVGSTSTSSHPDSPGVSLDSAQEERKSPFLSSSPAISASASLSPNPRERALVSQLLAKIRELEDTNTHLAAQHLEARLRLRQAEQETEGVKKLCEFISDEVELEIVGDILEDETEQLDADPSNLEASPRRTIRFRSIGRKSSLTQLNSENKGSNRNGLRTFTSMENLSSPESRNRTWSTQATLKLPDTPPIGAGRPKFRPRKTLPKSRKSIRDIFGEDSSMSSTSSSKLSDGFGGLAGAGEDGATGRLQDDAVLCTSSSTSSERRGLPSLSAELGDEFANNFGVGMRPSMAHLRSKSIMEVLKGAEQEHLPILSTSSRPASIEERQPIASPEIDEEITFPKLRRAKSSIMRQHSQSSTMERTVSLSACPEEPKGSLSVSPSSMSLSVTKDQKSKGYVSLLVELWLWMQFAIVIVVFVFTMTRMGPKSFFRQPPTSQKSRAH